MFEPFLIFAILKWMDYCITMDVIGLRGIEWEANPLGRWIIENEKAEAITVLSVALFALIYFIMENGVLYTIITDAAYGLIVVWNLGVLKKAREG